MKTAFKYTVEEVTTKEILQYAVKGLKNELQEIENEIKKYIRYIAERENGCRIDNSPLSIEGLEQKIETLRISRAKLQHKLDIIKWELETNF